MGSSHTSVCIHYVFSTKGREPFIKHDIEQRIWAYIGGILKKHGINPLCIGGMPDHVHVLASLPSTMPVSKAVQLMKGGSSKWIHDNLQHLKRFQWQEGYAAYSVSMSRLAKTQDYIKNQREHHGVRTFKEEYLAFLQMHNIPFDDRYVWK